VRFGEYEVDLDLYELRCAGELVELPPRAFDLLAFLLENRGKVVSKSELMRALWPDTVVTKDSLPHAVMAVRRALGASTGTHFIATVRGRGYRFVGDAHELLSRCTHCGAVTAVQHGADV
jgi:DNA-binding winged helix-turn-helix (wHTH) protein